MNLTNYKDPEVEFLEEMATRLGMKGKNRIIFVERFRQRNADSIHKVIAERYQTELLEGTKGDDAERVFRQQLSAICRKLEAQGCNFPEHDQRAPWQIVMEWLQTVHYPKWAKERLVLPQTCDELWGQLWEKATPTDTMKPVVVKKPMATLDMGGDEIVDDDIPSVRLGSHIYFQLHLEQGGYLLLLEKGTSGRFWCLSPSAGFVPNPYLSAAVWKLPLLGARNQYFRLTGNPGKEEVVAVVTKEKPALEWLSLASEGLLKLEEGHLKGVLKYLNNRRDCQVLRMAYRVTA